MGVDAREKEYQSYFYNFKLTQSGLKGGDGIDGLRKGSSWDYAKFHVEDGVDRISAVKEFLEKARALA